MSKRPARFITASLDTPLGPMLAGAADERICLLEFADRPLLPRQLERVQASLGSVAIPGHHPRLDRLAGQLAEYFAGARRRFDIPLAFTGTPFQARVWRLLLDIPYGTTISYAELARRTGSPGGYRAVGRANGDNRMAIVVPCHRVVPANGGLGGYGGGVHRKQRLLDLEGGLLQTRLL